MAKKHLSRLALGSLTVLLASLPLTAYAAISDVSGLEATPGDETVHLEWDEVSGASSYNVYIGLSSVEEDGGDYTFGSTSVEDNSYTVEDLSNGVTYYFAVTAVDENGDESEAFSNEVSAEPSESSSDEDDETAPTVKSAEALSSTQVKVEFSEDLASIDENDFSIEAEDGSQLEITDAQLSDDASVVLLVTEAQEEGEEYIVTASSSVEDLAGNPVDSGSSDTATFEGSAKVADDDDDDDSEVAIESVTVLSINEVEVTFEDDPGELSARDFEIQESDDATAEIEVLAVTQDSSDPEVYTVITENMESETEYVLTVGDSSEKFESQKEDDDDDSTGAPADPEDFDGEAVNSDSIRLSWSAPSDTSVAVAYYLLYQLQADGTYGEGVQVSASKTEYNIGGLTAGDYTFKLTSVSGKEVESEGVTTVVTLAQELPTTGPGLLALVGLSAAGAGLWHRRKQK